MHKAALTTIAPEIFREAASIETIYRLEGHGTSRERSQLGRTPGKDKSHYGWLKGCSGWPKTNPSSDKNTPRALAID